MGRKRFFFYILSLVLVFSFLLAACEGAGGNAGDETGWSEDPEPTLSGGGTGGSGEEPEEPDEPDEEEEGEDMDLVPLVAPCAPRDGDAPTFQIHYQNLTWNGPPQLKIGPAVATASIDYDYDEEKKVGVFQLVSTGLVEMPIEVIFPECRGEPFDISVEFQARAEGTCKDNLISLTVYEIWNSVSEDLMCEADSDVCGDDPCPFPLLLPFAYAGEQGITVKYQLDPVSGVILEENKELPFMGAGASGTKVYSLLIR